jgi:hypothetical protein
VWVKVGENLQDAIRFCAPFVCRLRVTASSANIAHAAPSRSARSIPVPLGCIVGLSSDTTADDPQQSHLPWISRKTTRSQLQHQCSSLITFLQFLAAFFALITKGDTVVTAIALIVARIDKFLIIGIVGIKRRAPGRLVFGALIV